MSVLSYGPATRTHLGRVRQTVVNVSDYGAVGNGVANDTAAITAAIAAAQASALVTGQIATVQLMPGTHLVSLQAHPTLGSTVQAALWLPGNICLRGHGIGSTTIKLSASIPSYSTAIVISNLNIGSASDQNLTLKDFSVDGDGAHQTNYYQGISLARVRGAYFDNVCVKNIFGDAVYPPGETFAYDLSQCVDCSFMQCWALGDAGSQGSGFGDNQCTNIRYTQCTARGISVANGFTTWQSAGISYVNCTAQQCGNVGFNCEGSTDISYDVCRSGGIAAANAGSFWHTNSQTLGNAVNGFMVSTSSANVEYANCMASYNTSTGLQITASTSVRVTGGKYALNAMGIGFGDVASIQATNVSPMTDVSGNTTTNWSAQGSGSLGYFSTSSPLSPAPSVPASGTTIINPYPFTVTVYIIGSINWVGFPGYPGFVFAPSGSTQVVVLLSGEPIHLDYSTAPTWFWRRD